MKKIMRLTTLALLGVGPRLGWIRDNVALRKRDHFLFRSARFGLGIRRAVLRAGRL
jgi:hypothetical protein